MALERTYTIPLRKEWLKAPKYKRAKKAIKAIKEFLARHMKSEDIRILKELNLEVWKHGIKNPPCRVKVDVIKDDKDVVRANLFGKSLEAEKKPEEAEKPKSKLAQAVEKMKGKPTAKTKKKEKKEEPKKETELEKKIKVKEVPKEEVNKEVEKPKEVKSEIKKEIKPEAKETTATEKTELKKE